MYIKNKFLNKRNIVWLLAGFVFLIFGAIGFLKYDAWYQNYKANKIITNLQKPYLEDTYGGDTPEETFDMFLDALKKDDIELASKYFYLDAQEEWRDVFINLKDKNKLEKHINQWEMARKNWNVLRSDEGSILLGYKTFQEYDLMAKLPDGAGGFIEQVVPSGIYNSEILLIQNLNSKWKIKNL